MAPPSDPAPQHAAGRAGLAALLFFWGLRHPESWAIVFGILAGSGTAYFVHGLELGRLKRIRPHLTVALLTFLWTAFFWARLDADGDIHDAGTWGIIGAAALCAPLVNAAAVGAWRAAPGILGAVVRRRGGRGQ